MSQEFLKMGNQKKMYIQDEKVKLKRLVCVWCNQIFKEPQRLYCGHTICNRCLQDELYHAQTKKGFMRCIICGQIVEEQKIGQDRLAQGVVAQISVRCTSKKCTWTGQNKDFQHHYDHQCSHSQRTCQARYQYQYYSSKAEFVSKLNDEEQKNGASNMLHPGAKPALKQKIDKQWEIQQRFKDELWKKQTRKLRHTFG